jgi:hypothetical protein
MASEAVPKWLVGLLSTVVGAGLIGAVSWAWRINTTVSLLDANVIPVQDYAELRSQVALLEQMMQFLHDQEGPPAPAHRPAATMAAPPPTFTTEEIQEPLRGERK